MGNRSMRFLTSNPDLFRAQYRAMRRAAEENTKKIIFPMVNGKDEMDEIMAKVKAFEAELKGEGFTMGKVEFGIMVEVPSVVECFEDMVEHFDRFNIGTNDLTQYTLAADRNNQDVSQYFSTFHPAVIRMIEKICRIGNAAGKSVCLCGEVAFGPARHATVDRLGGERVECALPLRASETAHPAAESIGLPKQLLRMF